MARPKKHLQVELALDARAALGEGPVWHAKRQRLFWVNILAGELHEFNPATGLDSAINLGQMVGCVALRKKGGLLLGLQHGFARFNLQTKKLSPLFATNVMRRGCRMNDGKCDPAGRFWAGTMHCDAKSNQGELLFLGKDLCARRIIRRLTIPNGLAWSSNLKTMYFIDSGQQVVWAFNYENETGRISHQRAIIDVAKREGVPDGMTIDVEGMLWIAHWGSGQVIRWNPKNGKPLKKVSLPVSQVTSCTFGGAKLDTLYITSARTSLHKQKLAREPLAGGLFCLPTNVPGTATHTFAG